MNELQDLAVSRGFSAVYSFGAEAAYTCQPAIQIIERTTTLADFLDLSGDTAGWVIEAVKKLESLGRFRANWDSYGGLPLTPRVKSFTIQVLGWLRKSELPVPAVVLGSAGNVQLEWRANGKELDVELRDDNSIEYVRASADGSIEDAEVAKALPETLSKLTLWLAHR